MTLRLRMPEFLALAALAIVWPATALAYVDPGSGGFLVQSILAVLAGAAIFLREWRQRFMLFLQRLWKKPPPPDGRG
jgi:hypothetical protein